MKGMETPRYGGGKLTQPKFVWEQLVKEFEASSCSVKEFCVQRGLAFSTFHGWRKKLRPKPCKGHAPSSPGFVPVTVTAGEDASILEEKKPQGAPWRLKIDDRFDLWVPEDFKEDRLKRLLKVLGSC